MVIGECACRLETNQKSDVIIAARRGARVGRESEQTKNKNKNRIRIGIRNI